MAALPAHVAVVTLGAEQPLAVEATRQLSRARRLVSIGHSTASEAEFDAVVAAGAHAHMHFARKLFGRLGIGHRRAFGKRCGLGDLDIAEGQSGEFATSIAIAGCRPAGMPSVSTNQAVSMVCWQKGSWSTGDYGTDMWFWVTGPAGEGFVTASVVRNQVAPSFS